MTAKRLVPLSGIAAVVAIIASFAISGETPDADAPVNEVVAFYTEHDSDQLIAGTLLAYGALLFLIFSSTVAGFLRRAQGDSGGPSALAFGGGVLFTVGALIFAGLAFTLGDAGKGLDPAAVQALNALSSDLFFPVAIGLVAFLLGSGIGILRTRALPSWLGWVAIVAAIVGLTPVGFFALPVLGLWSLVVSALLFRRADLA